MAQATFAKDSGTIDYTPGSAVDAGDVIVQKWTIGIATQDIAANAKGALAVEGEFDVVKKNEAIVVGDIIYWDANGDPYGGTSGTGAASAVRSSGDLIMGHATAAAGATDSTVRVRLTHYTS